HRKNSRCVRAAMIPSYVVALMTRGGVKADRNCTFPARMRYRPKFWLIWRRGWGRIHTESFPGAGKGEPQLLHFSIECEDRKQGESVEESVSGWHPLTHLWPLRANRCEVPPGKHTELAEQNPLDELHARTCEFRNLFRGLSLMVEPFEFSIAVFRAAVL